MGKDIHRGSNLLEVTTNHIDYHIEHIANAMSAVIRVAFFMIFVL